MKAKLNALDQALFREAMREVKPLRQHKVKIAPLPPKRLPRKKPKLDALPPSDNFSDHEFLEPVSSEDRLDFARANLPAKLLRSLRRGPSEIEAVLDLHGMIVEEARLALHLFLLESQLQGTTYVLIIHGKGRDLAKPILKNKLNHWLRQAEQVLAFCSAKPKDGGSGALYAWLKK